MPLRSVEAATRDDAIAAAREQFGPQARVVGVRRVRSGGVLGFFATERYVAEVAPDAGRPPVPGPARGARDDDLGSSPLASAAPATAARRRPHARAPRAGPQRGRRLRGGGPVREPAESARPAVRQAPRPGGRRSGRAVTAPRPADPPIDDARVSELAGLLGAAAAEPQAPSYARPASPDRRLPEGHVREGALDGGAGRTRTTTHPLETHRLSSAPSPFTAALARMVAGDTHVRQAVEDAVEDSAGPARRGATPPRSRAPTGPVDARAISRHSGVARCGSPGGGNGGRSGHRALHARGTAGGGAHLGRRARGRRDPGLLARGGDRRDAALRPRPGPLRRGAGRHPAQGPRRRLAAGRAHRAGAARDHPRTS